MRDETRDAEIVIALLISRIKPPNYSVHRSARAIDEGRRTDEATHPTPAFAAAAGCQKRRVVVALFIEF